MRIRLQGAGKGLAKLGSRARQPTERLKNILPGRAPIGTGALSAPEVRARNSRLKSLVNDLEESSRPDVNNGAGAGLDEVFDDVGASRQEAPPSKTWSRGGKLREGILVDNGIPLVSPILARDACKCSECVDPSDRQRNFSYADIPTDIGFSRVTPVESSGDTIVSWRNDAPPHSAGTSTIFDKETISSLRKPFRNPRWHLYSLAQKLWDAESFTRDSNRFDFNEYMSSDDALADALHLLWRDGLVFIDGVPESEGSVSQLVTRIGPLMNTFYGPTWDVRSVPNPKNVAYTAKYLGFHMDLLYMREPPAFQFLHCIHNESVGGESRFADTFKAVDELYSQDPAKIRDLMTYPVRYEYDNDGYFYSDQKPTILKRQELNVPNRPTHNAQHPHVMSDIGRVYWSPPFVGNIHPKLEHHELVRFVAASNAFASILERPDMVIEEKMDSGTCVIFDNLRVVHARNAFDLNSGRRWLRGAYLARQDFVSKASSMVDRMPANIRFYTLDGEQS
ncbi:hypothetical protein AYO21_08841 [Fonsecaea monophora]|uniref:TauD/TfdA-like domain-containing protein n=1 Tax=Fonsecaea monophora TaxID=254056 RepID=A0A177EYE9_9EURO|nr:hypothetical protein AYO21_08841 [Fonsecaea monophora]KAH0837038.1 gamma-butyrobetaine dioxygenase [Fonsecaea pedrosoi]OAG36988.1 hypothetical protein AYO21_08841 [Fonsecaea monophora]